MDNTKGTTVRNASGQRLGHVAAEINSLRMTLNAAQHDQEHRDKQLVQALDRLAASQKEAATAISAALTELAHTIEQLRNQVDTLAERVDDLALHTDTYIISGIDGFNELRKAVAARGNTPAPKAD